MLVSFKACWTLYTNVIAVSRVHYMHRKGNARIKRKMDKNRMFLRFGDLRDGMQTCLKGVSRNLDRASVCTRSSTSLLGPGVKEFNTEFRVRLVVHH